MSGFGTAITASIGADVGPLQQSGPQVDRAVGNIASKMEHRLVGAQHLATAAATAVGLNVEKMAEFVAAHIFGITEEAKKAWQDLAELSTRYADRVIAANRAKLDLGKQYQLSLQDEQRLRDKIDANVFSAADKQAEKKRDQLALLDKEAVSAALLARINQEAADRENASIENQYKLRGQLEQIKADDAEAAKKRGDQMAQEDLEWYKQQDKAEKEKKAAKLAAIEEVKAAEIAAFEEAAAVEKARVAEMFKSFIDQWTGLQGVIASTGRGDKDLSDRELARKAAAIRQDIFSRTVASQGRDPDFFLDPQRSNLAQTLAEQRERATVLRNASAFGEDRAFQMFGGSEQRFAEIMRTATDSRTIVTELKALRADLQNGRTNIGTTSRDRPSPIPAGG